MQVYVQKSTSTTFPRSAAGVSGREFSHVVASASDGNVPSTGSRATREDDCRMPSSAASEDGAAAVADIMAATSQCNAIPFTASGKDGRCNFFFQAEDGI